MDRPYTPGSSSQSNSRSPSPSRRSVNAPTEGNRPRVDTVHLTPYQTYSQLGSPPPLPPRPPPGGYQDGPPSYSQTYPNWHASRDPRTSSMHSLRPIESQRDGRRTLMLIYIHGFMGNETSFRSFPAHVHNLLTVTLAETHVVHTKIYPKYKSKRAIEYARDDFSNWLCPHESPSTDVVLLGHSMGGILSAEVALLPPYSPMNLNAFRHRILGTISFDTPFLGMHPGVIVSGIGSLFRAAPEIPKEPDVGTPDYVSSATGMSTDQLTTTASIDSSSLSSPIHDPNFDPPYPNDIRMQSRSGWENAMHFVSKHSDGLTRATKQYVTSHLEFGGCLADYPGLRRRYDRLRGLEDIDTHHPPNDQAGHLLRRIRFLNFYTASTGRLKEVPAKTQATEEKRQDLEIEMKNMNLSTPPSANGSAGPSRDSSRSPRISLHEHRDGRVIEKELQIPDGPDGDGEMRSVSPRPMSDTEMPGSPQPSLNEEGPAEPLDASTIDESTKSLLSPVESTFDESIKSPLSLSFMDSLPPIPPSPQPPLEFDPTPHTDKDTLKLAKKEHARLVKAYERSQKDREKVIKDRQKLIEKREKALRKESDKQTKLQKKQQVAEEKESIKRRATLNPEAYDNQLKQDKDKDTPEKNKGSATTSSGKKPKDRKFCVLPGKDRNGKRDPKWVRVFMEGVDEVGAHCGLFFMSETYEMLVGDVAGRIEEWVKEDATDAMVWEEMEKARPSSSGGGSDRGRKGWGG